MALGILAACWVGLAGAPEPAFAADGVEGAVPTRDARGMLRLRGQVADVTPDSLVIRAGDLLYELRRDRLVRVVPEAPRMGDAVEVVYRESAQEAYPIDEPAQRAGRAGGKPEAPAPAVLDDRAFYFARTIAQ
jgi:hypothetical protein